MSHSLLLLSSQCGLLSLWDSRLLMVLFQHYCFVLGVNVLQYSVIYLVLLQILFIACVDFYRCIISRKKKKGLLFYINLAVNSCFFCFFFKLKYIHTLTHTHRHTHTVINWHVMFSLLSILHVYICDINNNNNIDHIYGSFDIYNIQLFIVS